MKDFEYTLLKNTKRHGWEPRVIIEQTIIERLIIDVLIIELSFYQMVLLSKS